MYICKYWSIPSLSRQFSKSASEFQTQMNYYVPQELCTWLMTQLIIEINIC